MTGATVIDGAPHAFTCNLCEAFCGLSVTVEGASVTRLRGNDADVFSRGHLCPKAHGLKELLTDPDRLRAPRIREGSAWRDASWDEALGLVSERLRAIRERHGPDSVALYVGNAVVHSHKATLAAQLLTTALGTRNRFDPNSQDGNPRLYACMQMYGDALSIPVPDLERTDYLLMLGANPAVSHGSQMVLGDPAARFRAIRERGGRIVLVDPRRTETAAWCTSHHFIRPGGDAALLLGVLHVLFDEQRIAEGAVGRVASGLAELRALAARFAPERVAASVGIGASTIRRLACEFPRRSAPVPTRASECARARSARSRFGWSRR